MYILRVPDCLNIGVRVDSVQEVANKYHGGPELRIEATLRLSPTADEHKRVVLWASDDEREYFTVDEDFVNRDIMLEGHCPDDHENPYSRQSVGISAIWFDKNSGILALVRSELR